MKPFFLHIEQHPILFFWVSVLYMAVCSPVCEILTGSKWLHALVILPINFVTWPVAHALLASGRWKSLNFMVRRFAGLLPVLSVVLPFAPILFS